MICVVEQCAPIEKVYSIDEAAVRLVGRQRQPDEALTLGRTIKEQLRRDVGEHLTATVGMAPTRLLAKIASDMHKPDGLGALRVCDLPGALSHLKLDDLPGISRGMLARLAGDGVFTIEQLWNLSRQQSRRIWGGVQGEHWWDGLHGCDQPELATHRRSIGHSHVLAPALRNNAAAHAVMTRLLHKAAARLRDAGYWANRLHAAIRYQNGGDWADQTDPPCCRDTRTLLAHFQRLWRRRNNRSSTDRPVHVAVTLTELTSDRATTGLLFEQARRDHRLADAMDCVNRRWGKHTLYFGGMHALRQPMDDKIAFGRVPNETIGM